MRRTPGIELKTPEQLKLMRAAGLVVFQVLQACQEAAAPGVTTRELDLLAREMIKRAGATSSFLHYGAQWGYPPFPAVTCTSVNNVVVHGIPGDHKLQDGDLVSIDFGVHLKGFHGDSARTFSVGTPQADRVALSDTTREALWAGISAYRLGGRVSDISHAIEKSIRSRNHGFGILREYTGHGIGSAMHQPPDVPNVGRGGQGPRIMPGLCLAIEPMVTRGSDETATLDDDWTVVTTDGSDAAHWEHTVTATRHGLWVLTAEDGGEAELTKRGLPFGPLAD